MAPSEVDGVEEIANGSVNGAKNAAIRKLQHELGIPKQQLVTLDFCFVTRLHYWAADTVTHGPKSPYGEHEIDYVLLARLENAESTLSMTPHPEEIQDTKWVSRNELQSMLNDSSLLMSPWFRIICDKWLLRQWWVNLDDTFHGKFHDFETIHTFDPPSEHIGGAGNANRLFDTTENDGKAVNVKLSKGGDARFVFDTAS